MLQWLEAGSKLVVERFEAGSKLVADMFEAKFHYAIWFEAGVKEFGFKVVFEPQPSLMSVNIETAVQEFTSTVHACMLQVATLYFYANVHRLISGGDIPEKIA